MTIFNLQSLKSKFSFSSSKPVTNSNSELNALYDEIQLINIRRNQLSKYLSYLKYFTTTSPQIRLTADSIDELDIQKSKIRKKIFKLTKQNWDANKE